MPSKLLAAVDPAYWAHPLDVAAQVGGIKLARRMLVAPPLDSIYAGEFEPGANKTTDADIERWLRGVVASDNHEVGSLSMMPQSLGGVIDTSLKVYGTANVRVADASIIPFPVSAHLSSTVYMIGERPTWSTNLLDQYIDTINASSKYDNMFAYNVRNEVLTSGTNAAPFIKTAVCDIKAYLACIAPSALVAHPMLI
ncbi:putative alcohol oxidase [Mycena sanguinolenta]|uniref:1,3-beta-glucanosyltransferase n=1 Tax=Mycena sanguinolenta TaxID=230812 RepID=A0A8H6XQB8_9AGAR|nr:putative alcohol oxidase [Mycena sanguinolenta]